MGSSGSKDEGTPNNQNGISNQTNRKPDTSRNKFQAKQEPKSQDTNIKNNNTKNSTKVVSKFDSDSDSEDEIINSQWKSNNNSRTTNQNSNNRTTEQSRNDYNSRVSAPPVRDTQEYPETYAQRTQRAQYAQNGMLPRQKTMYRNPDEWEIDDEVRCLICCHYYNKHRIEAHWLYFYFTMYQNKKGLYHEYPLY